MLAIAAAVSFGLALLLNLTDASLGDTFGESTFVVIGLILIALHLGGIGSGTRAGIGGGGGRSWNWRRTRR
ncbi:hypothetical protein HLB23_16805 [Nocardia uniformis]|uniref:Uncharacterized protein n=1 Tax=Nocardia uniformis TaxID=53432 RepID=A0A849BYY9_9NOCA|nr:hypothetical protein [Nocardia uniformis]NNH71504.1 hypothetical protein [Nocardia uniformis]